MQHGTRRRSLEDAEKHNGNTAQKSQQGANAQSSGRRAREKDDVGETGGGAGMSVGDGSDSCWMMTRVSVLCLPYTPFHPRITRTSTS